MSLFWVRAMGGRVYHVREAGQPDEHDGAYKIPMVSWWDSHRYTPALCGATPGTWYSSWHPAKPGGEVPLTRRICSKCRAQLDAQQG